MSVPARIILVGAGMMGSNHARVIAQSDAAELVAVVDPYEVSGRALADRMGSRWLPELPDLEGVDGVVVAAATEAHVPIATAVLEQDTGLLIEKPVAADFGATRAIVDLATARSIPLMCGLLERFNPAILTALDMLHEPVHVSATRHSPYAPRIRTGVGWDLLVHDVDLAIRVIGSEPTSVDSHLGFFHGASAPGAEDVGEAILGFDGGQVAQISASRVGQRKIRTLSINETDRLIEVDLLRRDVTVYRHISENAVDEGRGYRQQTVIEIPELVTSKEPLTAQFDTFLGYLGGRGDADGERRSILPPHRVVDDVIARGRSAQHR